MKTAYSKLNPGQKCVVDHYVDGAISMADAVIEAGFAQFEGFTEHDVAQRLLASPLIQRAIEERRAIVHDQGTADRYWHLRRMVDYLNVDPTSILTADGLPLPPHRWSEDLRRMVKRMKFSSLSGALEEVVFEPKTKILELVGRTDLVGAFAQEAQSDKTVVIIRDMTQQQVAAPAFEVECLTSEASDASEASSEQRERASEASA